MSMLASYREKEELMRKLQDELRRMEENKQLQEELNFKKDIEAVLDRYERSPKDLVQLFGLTSTSSSGTAQAKTGSRRKRKLKVYKNPNTGEVIETRGGNHKDLKAWKAEFGNDTVEGWVVEERD